MMNKRTGLFFLCFVGFYYFLQVANNIPDVIRGNSRFLDWPGDKYYLFLRFADVFISFLFALSPYLILFRFYPKKRMVEATMLILLALPLLFFIRYVSDELMVRGTEAIFKKPVRLRTYFSRHIFYIILYTIYGLSFYFIRYSYFKELQQKDLQLLNRESELSFLRSQINPHFLFNSLNNIYSLVYHKSTHSLEAIAGFSDILRYMLYDTMQDVPLTKEADYIRKYIAMQQLRYEYPVKSEFKTKGNLDEVFIPPLLLIPFVENAFKHGNFDQEGGEINILLETDRQKTRFYCQNKITFVKKDGPKGIGLRNVHRRLTLLYPDRHNLTIVDGPVFFIVKLELNHEYHK